MPTYIPLFPLSSVVFPDETLKLFIFEPRYKQLIQECLEEEKTFAIPAVVEKELASVATEIKVVSLDFKFEDGRMNITTLGLRRVSVRSFDRKAPGKLYPGGEVDWLESDDDIDLVLQQEVYTLILELNDVVGISQNIVDKREDVRAFSVAHHIGLSLEQKIQILTMDKELDRLTYVKDHLEKIMPIVRETEKLKARARLNGHYKNMIPPDF